MGTCLIVASSDSEGGVHFADPTLCLIFGTPRTTAHASLCSTSLPVSCRRTSLRCPSVRSPEARPTRTPTRVPTAMTESASRTRELVRASSFNLGAWVAQETFALSFGFQTFMLLDPDWSVVVRVLFQSLDAAGNPGTTSARRSIHLWKCSRRIVEIGPFRLGWNVRCRAARQCVRATNTREAKRISRRVNRWNHHRASPENQQPLRVQLSRANGSRLRPSTQL